MSLDIHVVVKFPHTPSSSEFLPIWSFYKLRGLSGKYPAILNISRTGRVTLM